MDQLFSILSSEFKKDIVTVDQLIEIMKKAPIEPKPDVESMLHINDWRGFMDGKLYALQYHTRYNSFKFTKEEEEVKLRCKRLPQSAHYGPENGLQLIVEGFDLNIAVGSSDFRVDQLDLDNLLRYVKKKFDSFPLFERMEIISSWDLRCKKLRDLPRLKEGLSKMSLSDLPRQIVHVPRDLPAEVGLQEEARIIGEEFPDGEAFEGHVEEILPGMTEGVPHFQLFYPNLLRHK